MTRFAVFHAHENLEKTVRFTLDGDGCDVKLYAVNERGEFIQPPILTLRPGHGLIRHPSISADLDLKIDCHGKVLFE